MRALRKQGIDPDDTPEAHARRAAARAELDRLRQKQGVRPGPFQWRPRPRPGAFACYWCGGAYAQNDRYSRWRRNREHLTPRALGGTDWHENIVWAHAHCNTQRGMDTRWVPHAVHGIEGSCAGRAQPDGPLIYWPADSRPQLGPFQEVI